ncbi:hypothetical protein LTS10_005082 [Elasticomyces elasticus]|nr:hypothetical protein LTS10_005082 [Elasticomyces elasticus]
MSRLLSSHRSLVDYTPCTDLCRTLGSSGQATQQLLVRDFPWTTLRVRALRSHRHCYGLQLSSGTPFMSSSSLRQRSSSLALMGRFTNKPGLLAVCHQIRLETLPIFLHLAPLVARSVFEVHNFDFRKVMTYIDTLDTAQCTALGRRRMLVVKVTIDTKNEARTEKGLRRWLHYCSTKLAGHLDISNYARQQSYIFSGAIPEYVERIGYRLNGDLKPASICYGNPGESDLVIIELQEIMAASSARNCAISLRRSFDKWID